MWLKLLTNKFTWTGILIIAIITYYNIKIFNMDVKYNKQVEKYNTLDSKYIKLDKRYNTKVFELKESIEISKSNAAQVEILERDYSRAKNLNKKNIETKDKEIKSLLRTIYNLKNLPKPTYPPEGVLVKDCMVYITPVGENNETNKTFDITSIGK